MHLLDIDGLIIGAFLLLTLVIGLRAGRGVKDMREYVLANRSFGSIALAITYLATNIAGASIFHTVAMVFADGAIRVFALLALFFVFLFCAFFIAPRAASFPDCLTMGDLMETFYGKTSKIIAGFLGLFTAFCIATMELGMLGEVGASLLGWDKSWTMILGGILLAFYAAHGGIKSVTATDVFQFLFLLIAIPVIAILTMEEAGGMKAVFSHVPSDKLQILNHPHFIDYLALALVWLLPLGMIDPAEMQRMLMGRKPKELRDTYLIVAVFDPALQLTLLLIGLSGAVLYPHIEPLKLMPHIVHHLMPIGFKGLVIAGLLGVVMSTIDSYFHCIISSLQPRK